MAGLNEYIISPKNVLRKKYNIVKPIMLEDKQASFGLKDAWLSGFTDGEGTFQGVLRKRVRNNKTVFNFHLVFKLTQKDAETILKFICSLFGSGFVYLTKEGVNRIDISAFYSHVKIHEYFLNFPLKSKKKYSFNK